MLTRIVFKLSCSFIKFFSIIFVYVGSLEKLMAENNSVGLSDGLIQGICLKPFVFNQTLQIH